MSISMIVPKARFSAQARLRALQADIMELILDRDLDSGDPMPTENELCEVLGVGRNTLRESLKVLQALGVIEIRHGFGMFVAPSNFDALADGMTFRGRLSLRHEGLEALQLVDIRQALEAGLISESISLVSPEHLLRIEATVVKMEELAERKEPFTETDAEFHRLLFEPLGNELLMNLMSVFWKVYHKIHVEIGTGGQDLLSTAAEHRAIYRAVAAKDGRGAAQLLSCHFDGIRAKIRKFVEAE
ncbi:DNA-binding FadR family transcriptional regulator [Arthrobacter psychrochitiniphilus]|uniref:GntR family transcriptional regulator n=2 Tax=Arthrobacter psychrochitiniphilus TaxID=291045 RepID=A0A2V3DVU8_9MICC|nr:FadR/GntR family transcriptional regulator [Arthrobacter psychrochitiniphilus]NYG15853.1 DNA-binding FadR family transcriptional regulator [Arthrobacter psychrochitiniphilus]PXA66709.1 GntR family transcriptional regulator [Arthrobacter psychrochitiniphilus]